MQIFILFLALSAVAAVQDSLQAGSVVASQLNAELTLQLQATQVLQAGGMDAAKLSAEQVKALQASGMDAAKLNVDPDAVIQNGSGMMVPLVSLAAVAAIATFL